MMGLRGVDDERERAKEGKKKTKWERREREGWDSQTESTMTFRQVEVAKKGTYTEIERKTADRKRERESKRTEACAGV